MRNHDFTDMEMGWLMSTRLKTPALDLPNRLLTKAINVTFVDMPAGGSRIVLDPCR